VKVRKLRPFDWELYSFAPHTQANFRRVAHSLCSPNLFLSYTHAFYLFQQRKVACAGRDAKVPFFIFIFIIGPARALNLYNISRECFTAARPRSIIEIGVRKCFLNQREAQSWLYNFLSHSLTRAHTHSSRCEQIGDTSCSMEFLSFFLSLHTQCTRTH
jgi:hypothetical protein